MLNAVCGKMCFLHATVSTVFLQPLLSAELTFRSIEVVNALCGRAALPAQFVHPYVAHCIACCEKIADKALQVSLIVCIQFCGTVYGMRYP